MDKRIALVIAGASAQSTATIIKAIDPDNVGADDRIGAVISHLGSGLVAYGSSTGDWRSILRSAGQELIAIADDPDIK